MLGISFYNISAKMFLVSTCLGSYYSQVKLELCDAVIARVSHPERAFLVTGHPSATTELLRECVNKRLVRAIYIELTADSPQPSALMAMPAG